MVKKSHNPVKDRNDRLKNSNDKGTAKNNGRTTHHRVTNTSTKVNTKSGEAFHGGNMYAIPATKKISMVKNGILKSDLAEIKKTCDLDYDTLSEILSVSRAKLINKKSNEKFDKNTSERIMHLRDAIEYGQSVFEDKDAFNKWLKKNNIALGGKTPLELMDTIYGIEEVKKEIGRIEYGVF